MIGYLSECIAIKINQYLQKTGVEFEKLKYGVTILLINLEKLSFIFIFAYFLDIVQITLVFFLCFSSLRMFAFGVHFKNNFKCSCITFLIYLLSSYISLFVHLNNVSVVTLFSISIFLLILYAPADTEKRPLKNKLLRKKLKLTSIGIALLLMSISLIIKDQSYKTCISLAVMIESILISPFTYKIFKERYKNYEKIY